MVRRPTPTRCTAPTTPTRSSRSSTASGCSSPAAADGGLHALKVRTGEQVWSYHFGKGVINGSPVVDGNLVYCHARRGEPRGRADRPRRSASTAARSIPTTKKPKLVWDTFRRPYKANRNQPLANRFGLASAALADGLLYVPDDSGELFCFRAKDGEMLWKYRYATEVRGSPLVADGKLYIFDVKARILILDAQRREGARTRTTRSSTASPAAAGSSNETNGTPDRGQRPRLLHHPDRPLLHRRPEGQAGGGEVPAAAGRRRRSSENAVAGVRLFPADVTAKPGEKVTFKVVLRRRQRPRGEEQPARPAGEVVACPLPPTPEGAASPPPRAPGHDRRTATLTLAADARANRGTSSSRSASMKARARVRVVPQIPVHAGLRQDAPRRRPRAGG